MEQEEELSTLLKKINLLKKEKETLTLTYEQDEEFLTNDHSMKLTEVGAAEGTDQMSHWEEESEGVGPCTSCTQEVKSQTKPLFNHSQSINYVTTTYEKLDSWMFPSMLIIIIT